jgi:general secretion pathway protein B
MSFILDAIAKSEQERQQQEVPGARILALPVNNSRKPRAVLPYFLVGALLLNAAVLVIWMQSGVIFLNWLSPTQVENKAQRIKQTTVSDNASLAGSKIWVETSPKSIALETISEIDTTTSMNESFIVSQDIAPAIGNEATVTQPETTQPRSAAITSEDTTKWIRIEPDTLSNNARSEHSAEPVHNKQDSGVIERRVSSLVGLPSDVRRDLPTVIFTGHLYSSDLNSSVVFVDGGRSVMTGRQIVDEVFLHKITPTGVIVEFRGYLIDVGVLQGWTLN